MNKIHPSSIIDRDAIIGEDCEIGPFCIVGKGVKLGNGNVLRSHVVMEGIAEIGAGNIFYSGCAIGTPPQDLKYAGEPTKLMMGDNNVVRECVSINRGTAGGGGITSIGSNCLFMLSSHVAHDCHLGDEVVMANCATLAGHVTVGSYSVIGGLTPVHQFVKIGEHAFIGGATRVSQDIVPYIKMGGIPPTLMGANSIGLARRGFTEEQLKTIDKVFRILFKSGLNTTQALQEIEKKIEPSKEATKIVEFIKASKRGIQK